MLLEVVQTLDSESEVIFVMSNRTYALYERHDGTATPHWQFWGKPKVPGCEWWDGQLYPPDPRWIVRASSITQACFFANTSATSLSRSDGLGVWAYGCSELLCDSELGD